MKRNRFNPSIESLDRKDVPSTIPTGLAYAAKIHHRTVQANHHAVQVHHQVQAKHLTVQVNHHTMARKAPPKPMGPTMPVAVDWAAGIQFGIMGNDVYGDCTSAAAGHTEQVWNTRAGHPWTPSDPQVLQFYAASGGSGVSGAYESNTLSAWQIKGVGGHVIYKWSPVNFYKSNDLRQAIFHTVGGVQLSLALPNTAVTQFINGQTWDVVSTTGDGARYSAGGHEIELTGYNSRNDTYTGVSWGREITLTGNFIRTYGTECDAVAGGDMYGPNGRTAAGENATQLNYDFRYFVA